LCDKKITSNIGSKSRDMRKNIVSLTAYSIICKLNDEDVYFKTYYL